LRAAITEANALAGADTITLPAGTYTISLTGGGENVNASGDFDLTSEITINGAGSGSTIVQASASRGTATERVFHLRATGVPTIINDLTVRYGRYTTASNTFGAGIRVDVGAVNATLTNVVVTENDNGTSGGGISVSGAANAVLTLNNCTVSNNTAGGTLATSSNGGGIQNNINSATVNVNNSLVTGNSVTNSSTTANVTGGGILSIGTLNVTNSTVSNNTTTSTGFNSFGGGIFTNAGTATITGSTVSGNSSNVTAGTGDAVIGGIFNQSSTLNISNSTISNNSVSNTSDPNRAFTGGIRSTAGTANSLTTITNSTISNNIGGTEGGGVANYSISAFTATINITGSTISGNSISNGIGGGLLNIDSNTGVSTLNVTNSTVSGNSGGSGSGSFNDGDAATINFNFATIASNSAINGGGVYQNTNGITNLKNSIVADNTASSLGPDIFGVITSQDYNHVENTTGGTFFARLGKNQPLFLSMANDVTGSDPQLGALANNGGSTFTQLPASGSPATNIIPNGVNDCGTIITTSQNGIIRPQNTGCEKGSAELAPTAANSSINGKLLTPNGRGLANAQIILTNTNTGEIRYARSSSFGYFNFADLPSGDFYLLNVQSKRFVFNQQAFNLSGDLDALVLIGQ
jgi:hypothetical protein